MGNVALQVSVWENPLAQWEHELVLRHSLLCRCLLPEGTVVGADGTVERVNVAGERVSGEALLQALQLPLQLVKRIPTEHEGDQPPNTPSTTRSFHTARSSRSQISSGRSKEEKRERRERRARERADRAERERGAASGATPVAPDGSGKQT